MLIRSRWRRVYRNRNYGWRSTGRNNSRLDVSRAPLERGSSGQNLSIYANPRCRYNEKPAPKRSRLAAH